MYALPNPLPLGTKSCSLFKGASAYPENLHQFNKALLKNLKYSPYKKKQKITDTTYSKYSHNITI